MPDTKPTCRPLTRSDARQAKPLRLSDGRSERGVRLPVKTFQAARAVRGNGCISRVQPFPRTIIFRPRRNQSAMLTIHITDRYHWPINFPPQANGAEPEFEVLKMMKRFTAILITGILLCLSAGATQAQDVASERYARRRAAAAERRGANSRYYKRVYNNKRYANRRYARSRYASRYNNRRYNNRQYARRSYNRAAYARAAARRSYNRTSYNRSYYRRR